MIYHDSKQIANVYHKNKLIYAIYKGRDCVYIIDSNTGDIVLCCFGSGYWIDLYPWLDAVSWKN